MRYIKEKNAVYINSMLFAGFGAHYQFSGNEKYYKGLMWRSDKEISLPTFAPQIKVLSYIADLIANKPDPSIQLGEELRASLMMMFLGANAIVKMTTDERSSFRSPYQNGTRVIVTFDSEAIGSVNFHMLYNYEKWSIESID